MSMNLLTPELRKQLRDHKIKIVAFMGQNKHNEPPFFIAGVAPAEENELGAVLDSGKSYALTRGGTPEEAVANLCDKLYQGL